MTPVTVLVTGAGGFVGRALVQRLQRDRHVVRAAVRQAAASSDGDVDWRTGLDVRTDEGWRIALEGVDCVVHCAARAHVLRDEVADPLAAFRDVNVEGTHRLLHHARAAGVRRFVLVSSIGVNGAHTGALAFRPDDAPAPHSPYAQSKLEAEQLLGDTARFGHIEAIIVRPPLVYAADAPGNFATMLRAVRRGFPLPLGAVNNKRSLVALDNLVDMLTRCVVHPAAPGRVWLVSDGEDLSTPELLRHLAAGMGRLPRLLPVPVTLLRVAGALLGRSNAVRSLCDSLQVDIGDTRTLLGWAPVISAREALAISARQFLLQAG